MYVESSPAPNRRFRSEATPQITRRSRVADEAVVSQWLRELLPTDRRRPARHAAFGKMGSARTSLRYGTPSV
jgi:hypothetical protein